VAGGYLLWHVSIERFVARQWMEEGDAGSMSSSLGCFMFGVCWWVLLALVADAVDGDIDDDGWVVGVP
jgi:hypothetical protein